MHARRAAAWRLEWRGSVHAPSPVLQCALHPSLPECALLLEDATLALCSLAPCMGVQAGELAAPLPLACHVLVPGARLRQMMRDAQRDEGDAAAAARARQDTRWARDGDAPFTPRMALAWGELFCLLGFA